MWDVSSLTRDQTCSPRIGKWSLQGHPWDTFLCQRRARRCFQDARPGLTSPLASARSAFLCLFYTSLCCMDAVLVSRATCGPVCDCPLESILVSCGPGFPGTTGCYLPHLGRQKGHQNPTASPLHLAFAAPGSLERRQPPGLGPTVLSVWRDNIQGRSALPFSPEPLCSCSLLRLPTPLPDRLFLEEHVEPLL